MKFIQIVPSQMFMFCSRTWAGIFIVSRSWVEMSVFLSDRKPTIIRGIPSKNDCAQNFNSLCCSNVFICRCVSNSRDVLSSR